MGRRITTWINGVQGVDYTEPDAAIPQKGKIGIQIHGGGKALIEAKDVTIEVISGGGSAEKRDTTRVHVVGVDSDPAPLVNGKATDAEPRSTSPGVGKVPRIVVTLVGPLQGAGGEVLPVEFRAEARILDAEFIDGKWNEWEPLRRVNALWKGEVSGRQSKEFVLKRVESSDATEQLLGDRFELRLAVDLAGHELKADARATFKDIKTDVRWTCTLDNAQETASERRSDTSATFVGAPEPPKAPRDSPLTPDEQQKCFSLPPGFEIELVASEDEGIGKFITTAWDHSGRFWTMTALDYPVDGNESPEEAKALFANPGKDKVLVYDFETRGSDTEPPRYKKKPRVFADGLAIPLGILPYKNGCIVQHGPDIVFLSDTNDDARADRRDVLLTGFGTQDSHLFPHGFTRGPGNWIYMAQGAFNDGVVKAKGGSETRFRYCKMARFTPDGQKFEIVSAGLNNIWGFVISREGEMFAQEANDLGYPVTEFQIGDNFPGIGNDKLKPYAPFRPAPVKDFQMGGTGLSGLALAEDYDTWPAPYVGQASSVSRDESQTGNVAQASSLRTSESQAGGPRYAQAGRLRHIFYIANPITSRIQAIAGTKVDGHYKFEKQPDFVLCSDPWFRPIHIDFGPDGCLYIVDWYNKIISHNEVPRNHPERDKTRGRIWRVKHKQQKWREVVDLTRLPEASLIERFDSSSRWESAASPNELAVRIPLISGDQAGSGVLAHLNLTLKYQGESADLSIERRLSCLNVRCQALRVFIGERLDARVQLTPKSSSQPIDPDSIVVHLQEMYGPFEIAKPSMAVLGAAGRAFGANPIIDFRHDNARRHWFWIIDWFARNIPPPGETYDAEYVRYLCRSAFETNRELIEAWLADANDTNPALESRVLAILALDPKSSASRLAKLVPKLDRPPNDEELLRLLEFPDEPGVAEALKAVMAKLASLEALLRLRTRLDPVKVGPMLGDAACELLGTNPELGLKLISGFKLTALEPDVAALLEKGQEKGHGRPARGEESGGNEPKKVQSHGQDARAPLVQSPLVQSPLEASALRTLRELGSTRAELFLSLTKFHDKAVRDEAIACLVAVPEKLLPLWPQLNALQRRNALSRLTTTKPGARALVSAAKAGTISTDDLDGPAIEKLQAVLGASDAELNSILEASPQLFRPVLVLDGHDESWIDSDITLDGAFTVESWVRLDPGIGNADGILGAPGVLDINFHDSRFRVWVGGGLHDVIIANKPIAPNVWTHVAVTRDAAGHFKIYLNGELDQAAGKPDPRRYEHVDVGRTNAPGGTAGAIAEFRIWNRERTSDEIRATFDRDLSESAASLETYFSGNRWDKLHGTARVSRTTDFPPLLSGAEAQALDEKVARFRALADAPGDPAAGKLVAAVCFGCHKFRGEGGMIGPDLSGAGAMGTEAVLRNLLAPNAAIEPGYRVYRVELEDGSLREGFLAEETNDAVILRLPGAEDQRIPQSDVRRASFTKRSLMPENLLDAFSPEQVRDLFAYLKTLK